MKETQQNMVLFQGSSKQLGYSVDFKRLLRSVPNAIRVALSLMNTALDKYDPAPVHINAVELRFEKSTGRWLEERRQPFLKEDKLQYTESGELITLSGPWVPMAFGRATLLVLGQPVRDELIGLTIQVLGVSNRELQGWSSGKRVDRVNYYKVNLLGSSFFVKQALVSTNTGFAEFKATLLAKKALAKFSFVKVVEPKLGFRDRNQSWYVSEWEEIESAGFASYDALSCTTLNDYGQRVRHRDQDITEEVLQDIEDARPIIRQIDQVLSTAGLNTIDLDANLFYSLSKKSFILLDVLGGESSYLGNPVRYD